MTHEYTLLLGGVVLPSVDQPPGTAIAWAEGIVLAVGSDEEVRAISRGDSTMLELRGAFVIPLGDGDSPMWPPTATFEVGGPADLAILASDPRVSTDPPVAVAIVRAGQVVAGRLW